MTPEQTQKTFLSIALALPREADHTIVKPIPTEHVGYLVQTFGVEMLKRFAEEWGKDASDGVEFDDARARYKRGNQKTWVRRVLEHVPEQAVTSIPGPAATGKIEGFAGSLADSVKKQDAWFEREVVQAAKSPWGEGWLLLSQDQKEAFVQAQLCRVIFGSARLDEDPNPQAFATWVGGLRESLGRWTVRQLKGRK